MSMIMAMLLAASAPLPDEPRPTGIDVRSARPLDELQACVTRQWLRMGQVTPVPITKGVALEFQMKSLFAPPGHPLLTFQITDAGEVRNMTIGYRRPWSAKLAAKLFRETAERCFPEAVAPPPS